MTKNINSDLHIRSNLLIIVILSLIPLLLHFYTNLFAGYGYFRDELYYLACSNRLDAGYVDQPPFSIYILYFSKLLFGDSIFAIRIVPALTSALTVFFTSLMAINLGGKKTAIIISSIAVIFTPVYLGMNSYFSMNSLDILLWTIAAFVIVLIINDSKLSYWIILGIILGLGLLNKIGFLWLGLGFFTGLLFTNRRKDLTSFKPYLTALIALVIFSPYIIWNFKNDFAHLEFIHNATSGKYSQLRPGDFIKGQFLNMNPASAVIWIAGLYYFLINREGKKYRMLGIIYLTSFFVLLINAHSKAEYLSPSYPMLFAGGSVWIEKIAIGKIKWLKYVVAIPVIIIGILIVPLAMPVLPVEKFIKYSQALGRKPSSSEDKELSELPQFYADMFGWEELASDVSKIYLSLSDEDKKRAVVFAGNYGEAGSIEFFKNRYPLPPVISNHNSFWTWGYPKIEDPVLIIIGGKKEDHLEFFESVDESIIHSAIYSMPYENNLPIFIVRNAKESLDNIWKKIKHFD